MSRVLIVCALVCFLLATFGIGAPVNLVALGLAFGAIAKLV